MEGEATGSEKDEGPRGGQRDAPRRGKRAGQGCGSVAESLSSMSQVLDSTYSIVSRRQRGDLCFVGK